MPLDFIALELRETVLCRLRQWDVAQGKMLVAVSGGADSLAALHLLCSLCPELQIQLVVGHFDHALRQESEKDAIWVQRHCEQLQIPCIASRWQSRSPEVSESAAREARYDFLLQVARQQQCRWIVTGHTADDQVETVLHHILRGTGLAGLSGMPGTRELSAEVTLIRPLLDLRRWQLEAWLQSKGLEWLTDLSNLTAAYTRNRLRQSLLPTLREQFNPQVDAALLRLATQAEEAQAALRWLARQSLERCVRVMHEADHTVATVECQPLRELPMAVLTTLFVELWTMLHWPRQRMNAEHWHALAEIVHHTGHPTGRALPEGITARWRRGVLSLQRPIMDCHP